MEKCLSFHIVLHNLLEDTVTQVRTSKQSRRPQGKEAAVNQCQLTNFRKTNTKQSANKTKQQAIYKQTTKQMKMRDVTELSFPDNLER